MVKVGPQILNVYKGMGGILDAPEKRITQLFDSFKEKKRSTQTYNVTSKTTCLSLKYFTV